MHFIKTLLAIFISTTAFALPFPEVLSQIERTYNPQIRVFSKGRGWSLYACSSEEMEIQGQDPVDGQLRRVHLTYYAGYNKTKADPTVILLPPTGGVNLLDRGYANELCWAGVNVALISTWDHLDPQSVGLEIHDQGALRSLAAVRHTVEFLSHHGVTSIGLLGTSIGAISGNLALGYEPRISSAVLIVGSGRFADVITESTEQGAVALRKQRMKKYALKNLEDYRKLVHENVKTDPASFIHFSGNKRVMTVTADQDKTVPTPYQKELNRLLNPDLHLALSGDHVEVIKKAFFQQRHRIVNFLKKTLSEPALLATKN